MATYADGVADIDLAALLDAPRAHGDAATMTVVRPELQFGVALIGEGDRVDGFHEKPRAEHWINGGFFVFEPRVFDYLTERRVLEREPLEGLAADGELHAFRHTGFWECMDTYKDATRAQRPVGERHRAVEALEGRSPSSSPRTTARCGCAGCSTRSRSRRSRASASRSSSRTTPTRARRPRRRCCASIRCGARAADAPSGRGPAALRNAGWRAAPRAADRVHRRRLPPAGRTGSRTRWRAARANPGAIVQGATQPDPDELGVFHHAPHARSQQIDPAARDGADLQHRLPAGRARGGRTASTRRFPQAVGEDTDLALRARAPGRRVRRRARRC